MNCSAGIKKGKESSNSKLVKLMMKTPRKVLSKARDFYNRSFAQCTGGGFAAVGAGHIGFGTSFMGCPTGQVLPKSYSCHSSSTNHHHYDFIETLSRAASSRKDHQFDDHRMLNNFTVVEDVPVAAAAARMPRSLSTSIRRIDEDRPCEFQEVHEAARFSFTRSRSCAVSNSR